jgi:O-succinylbenzoic acid--CoA ligase
MPDWLRQRAASTPERLALICRDECISYAELDRAVDVCARRLRDAGVAAGARVAILAGNGAGFAIAVHAVARAGAVLVPLNLRLTPAELVWQLADCHATHLVHDASRSDFARSLAVGTAALQLLGLERLTARPEVHPELSRRDLEGRANMRSQEVRFDLAATHSIIYTSGTTGRPKGALLTYGNHFWSAAGSALNLGLRPEDRLLACLPLFHVGGLAILLRSVIYGTTAVVHESFDPARVNAAIDNDGVTIVSVVANMLQRMLAERNGKLYPPTLRCVLLGGGPAPEPLLRDCAALGVPVVQTYGLTEAASQVATLAPEDALRKLGSAGKPLFGTEVSILAADGAICAADLPGEIVVRGPTVMPGYLNSPGETARALDGGWLHTGDVGYVDSEGYLYVLDRRDDLIVSGGENVYPAEIEAVLQSHSEVVEAGVYGAADERWGQTPVAVVVLRDGSGVTAEDLVAFCRERLAAYKTPSRIVFAPSLPRNAAGKLVRNELRNEG